MTAYFVGLVFDTTYGASEALNKVRAAQELGYTWVDDVAIIERHHSGRIATHTPHGSVAAGAGWGALLGALVGVGGLAAAKNRNRPSGDSDAEMAVEPSKLTSGPRSRAWDQASSSRRNDT